MNISQTEWENWYYKVYGYFFRRVNDKFAVEELTANTMNVAFMANNVQNFSAYLWKVAHNHLVKYIKLKNIEPMFVGLEEAEFVIDEKIENLVSDNYNYKLKQLKICIKNQLKSSDQIIIELSIYENKNSTEIGQILEIKPNTVRQKLARSLHKLREKCRSLWLNYKSNKIL
jgi:RNA polymerase sigma factor (sigma-70 family)